MLLNYIDNLMRVYTLSLDQITFGSGKTLPAESNICISSYISFQLTQENTVEVKLLNDELLNYDETLTETFLENYYFIRYSQLQGVAPYIATNIY